MADPLDVVLPPPGTDDLVPVGSTGDLVLTAGLDSLARWAERALVCATGGLHHRPTFGAGAERVIGSGGPAAAQRLASAYRKTLLDDPRIDARTRVVVAPSASSPGRYTVSASIVTVDGQIAQIDSEVARG